MKIKPILYLWLLGGSVLGQPSANEKAEPGLGNGLNFSLNEDQYRFKISGFLQPSYQYSKARGQKAAQTLRAKRAYLNFSGRAVKEKVTFLVQADFSAATPLLDAWIGYDFLPGWTLSAGQRRTFTNNREMNFDEDKLQFSERGLLSTSFSGIGREFGLFLQGSIGKAFMVKPQFALTSGDGANSFGTNASDVDLGGLKYGCRLDLLPLGDFSNENSGFAADLKHESKPKILLGLAGSVNNGASQATGEGHGAFLFYNQSKTQKLPDYRKLSADILLKYKGFHALAEFVNASATGLSGLYLDSTSAVSSILKPGQISQFLVLGNAWNAELGYVTRSGYSIDLRYEDLKPEFADQATSVLQKTNVKTIGLARYFNDHKLKLQTRFSQIDYTSGNKRQQAELLMQVVF